MSLTAALVLSLFAADAHLPKVAVAPLRGPRGAVCSAVLAAALKTEGRVTAWPASKRGSYSTFAELSQWLKEGSLDVEVVVLGHARNTKLIVEAYDKGTGSLVGLLKLKVFGQSCTLSSRSLERVRRWPRSWGTGKAGAQEVASSPPPLESAPVLEPPPPEPDATSEDKEVAEPELSATSTATEVATRLNSMDSKITRLEDQKTIKAQTQPSGPLEFAPEKGVVSVGAAVGLVDRTLILKDTNSERELSSGAFVATDVMLRIAPWAEEGGALAPLSLTTTARFAPGFASERRGSAHHLEVALQLGYAANIVRWPVRLEGLFGYRGYRMSIPGGGQTPAVGYHGAELGLGLAARVTERGELYGRAAVSYSAATEAISEAGGLLGIRLQAGFRLNIVESLAAVVDGRYSTYAFDWQGFDATDKTGALTVGVEASF